MANTTAVLLLPHVQVQNANAISGPCSWGFPAPTAFTGFVDALERRLPKQDFTFGGVGILCHRFEPQVFKPPGGYDPDRIFRLHRDPVKANGESASIIEEGRAHLEVSLVIEIVGEGLHKDDQNDFLEGLAPIVYSMRLAGGSILPNQSAQRKCQWLDWPDTEQESIVAFQELRKQPRSTWSEA